MSHKNEKAANYSAALALITLTLIGWFFPVAVIGWFLGAVGIATLTTEKEFTTLLVLFFPLVAVYGLFYAAFEYKKVSAYIKKSLETFKRHLK